MLAQSMRVENFRCFRQVDVRFTPLTVLVGPNACGKTALLRALTAQDIDPQRDVWQLTPRLNARIAWSSTLIPVVATTFQVDSWGDQPQQPWIRACQYLHMDVTAMRSPRQLRQESRLDKTASNLVNVIDTLPRRVQDELAKQLCKLVPVLSDVDRRPLEAGFHRLVFQERWKPTAWYEATEVSDGTMLALGLLTLQHQENTIQLVAIEEPERGLHPYLLGELVELFRKIAIGDGGRPPMQIVLATQSAELLEFLEPEEVRFLSRSSHDGGVVVEEAPIGSDAWRDAYAVHQESLASLWLSGGLGGIPTS